MSANPEAFEFLRKSAYGYVQRHGKDLQALRYHCRSALDIWLQDQGIGCDLSAGEAVDLVDDVSRWVSENYRKPQPKAARRRQERAAHVMAAPLFLEYAVEDGVKPSIRNAARLAGRSKSAMARHLLSQGISPVRERRIKALSAPVKRLVRILDTSFPNDGAWIVRLDHCIAKLWDGSDALPDALPRSTRSERRKKLPEMLATITRAAVGFNILVNGDIIGVRRGRRFQGVKNAASWMEEEERVHGFKLLRLPAAKSGKKRFWDDPWLSDVLDVMITGATCRTFRDTDHIQPWLRLLRPLLDPRPLLTIIDIAIHRAVQDDFVRDLEGLSAVVTDKEVRIAGYRLASAVETILHSGQNRFEPSDYFSDIDRELGFMNDLSTRAPESYAKLAYFRHVVLPEAARTMATIWIQCRRPCCGAGRCKTRNGQELGWLQQPRNWRCFFRRRSDES